MALSSSPESSLSPDIVVDGLLLSSVVDALLLSSVVDALLLSSVDALSLSSVEDCAVLCVEEGEDGIWPYAAAMPMDDSARTDAAAKQTVREMRVQ